MVQEKPSSTFSRVPYPTEDHPVTRKWAEYRKKSVCQSENQMVTKSSLSCVTKYAFKNKSYVNKMCFLCVCVSQNVCMYVCVVCSENKVGKCTRNWLKLNLCKCLLIISVYMCGIHVYAYTVNQCVFCVWKLTVPLKIIRNKLNVDKIPQNK